MQEVFNLMYAALEQGAKQFALHSELNSWDSEDNDALIKMEEAIESAKSLVTHIEGGK